MDDMLLRSFGDIYDAGKFMQSLEGVVNVVKEQPSDISAQDVAVVRVPSKVTEEHIAEHVEPVFRTKSNLRLATYFPSVNMRKKKTQKSELDAVACLAMFGTLELQPEVREVVDSMVERLRTLSRKSDGQFVAIDLRLDMLEKRNCQGSKKCFDAQEIKEFLQKIGFNKDTTIYLTQSRWDSNLNALKDFFPKTYTKVRFFLPLLTAARIVSQLKQNLRPKLLSHTLSMVLSVNTVAYGCVGNSHFPVMCSEISNLF